MAIKDNRITAIIKLSRQAFGKYKLHILALTMLGILSGLLEGIGINALIPLFSFAMGKQQGGDDIVSQAIEKLFLYFNVNFSLKYLLVFICFLFVLKAIVLLVCNYIKIRITLGYEEETRSDLFSKTLKADWPYLLKQKLGYLETVLLIDVGRGAGLLQSIGGFIMLSTSLIIYILIAINISIYITLISLILGAILFLIFKPFIYKTRVAANKAAEVNKQLSHCVNENIIGLKTVKTMFVSSSVIKIAKEYFRKIKEVSTEIFMLKNITSSLMQPISIIFVCAVFAFSYKTPGFNLAALVAVTYLIHRIFDYIKKLQLSLYNTNESIPYLRNVLNYRENAKKSREKNQNLYPFNFNNSLEFKNVYFSYNAEKFVLSNINFNIRKGEMVGLIGPSGAGKTTIVDLILRLFDPGKGEILLDEKNISGIDMEKWRKNIGYVSQDIFLMNDTIENNIRFYDDTITKKDLIAVAKMANIHDFIESCPDKFETMIGERGILLSVGQRQRIIIARILARRPKFLILDEATSALDNESEIKIQKVIENLKGKITVFVIAHRLSTVINCDRLLVLENGKITEQGKPQDLLEDKKSYFYKVYNIRK